MTPVVVDSSALVELLRSTEIGGRVDERIFRAGSTRHIPDVCPVEVVSAFRGLVRAGTMPVSRAETALTEVVTFAAVRHPAEALLERAWSLRHNLTTYDALYVALAESLPAPLITTDGKFDTPVVRRLIDVEVIS